MMKTKYFLFISLLTTLLTLSACGGSREDKVSDAAKRFAEAVNNGDATVCRDMYEKLGKMNDCHLVDHINDDNVEVVAIKGDSIFEATMDKVKLVFRCNDNVCEIIDSRMAVEFPSIFYTIAEGTGMPMAKISDQRIYSMLGKNGGFISYLKGQNYQISNLFLSVSNGRYYWNNNNGTTNCYMTNNVTNSSSKHIDGSDYNVEFVVSQRSTGKELIRVTAPGQSIMPNSSILLTNNEIKGLYSIAVNQDLNWYSSIKVTLDDYALLRKYYDFKGNEYSRYSGSNND